MHLAAGDHRDGRESRWPSRVRPRAPARHLHGRSRPERQARGRRDDRPRLPGVGQRLERKVQRPRRSARHRGLRRSERERVHEYTAEGLWTVSIKDANEDQKPESLMATFAGEQRFDRNESGNAEFVRTVSGEICMTDPGSDGTQDAVDVEIHVFQTYDIGDNGTAEYRAALDLAASTRDANSDGNNETASVNVTAYEALDRNMDGYDELARGLELSFARTD